MRVAIGRVGHECLEHDPLQIGRDRRCPVCWQQKGLTLVGAAIGWRRAHQQIVEHRPGGVHIGGRGDRRARAALLGGRKVARETAHDHAVVALRDAKVEQVEFAAEVVDAQILGLDVTVDNLAAVEVGQGLEELAHPAQGGGQIGGTLAEIACHVAPADVLHGNAELPVEEKRIVDPGQSLVTELTQQFTLFEQGVLLAVFGGLAGLDHDLLAALNIEGAVGGAKASLGAEQFTDLVAFLDRLADRQDCCGIAGRSGLRIGFRRSRLLRRWQGGRRRGGGGPNRRLPGVAEASQLIEHGLRVGVPIGHIVAHRLQHHLFEFDGDGLALLTGEPHGAIVAVVAKRRLVAGQEQVQGGADGVDIASRGGDSVGVVLFGRRKAWRMGADGRLRNRLRQAEIEQKDLAGLHVHAQVGGLDIAMDDAPGVEVGEGLESLTDPAQGGGPVRRLGAPIGAAGQHIARHIAARDVLHSNAELTLVKEPVVHPGQTGMFQALQHLKFAQQRILLDISRRLADLDHHLAPLSGVEGQIGGAEPALFADCAANGVPLVQGYAWLNGHASLERWIR